MIKSILNDSQDFTSLHWCSMYPKIAFVRVKGYPIFSLLQNTGIYNFTIYLKVYEFLGETEDIFSCRDSKIREELAACSPPVKPISFLSCHSESLNKDFC